MLKLSALTLAQAKFGFAKSPLKREKIMKTKVDVAIIGGGPAGLTAALALGRSGRSVLVYDDNKGRNFATFHMMNFPSRDGTPPLEFRHQIKNDLLKYKEISFKNEKVAEIKILDKKFLINDSLIASKILLAHGVRDILPDIQGIKEAWGKNVFHCPYCHGHEFKNKKIGILADIPHYAEHMVPLLLGLSNKVTVFTNGSGIEIPAKLLEYVTVKTNKITNFKDIDTDCLVIRPPQELSLNLGTKLGCELTETGHYKIDNEAMTTIPGIYAAGDIVTPMQSVLNACAAGQKAGAMMNFHILKERFS